VDGRRRQYVPLSVRFADGATGTRILETFGPGGLAAWACLLAAAKRSSTQGVFSYSSEADAWSKLGLYGHDMGFTFEAFVALLGRLKQTRRAKRGRVVDVVLTHWGDWNQTIKRETEAEKKRRKRAQNTGDNTKPLGGTEGEGEGEPPFIPRRRRSRATPNSNGNGNGHSDAPPTYKCPHCRIKEYTPARLAEHVELLHAEPIGADPDIPF
jgi:hypothetical protein